MCLISLFIRFSDVSSWLSLLGISLDNVAPSLDFSGKVRSTSGMPESALSSRVNSLAAPRISSAFECAFSRDMDAISRVSTVPRSQLLPEPRHTHSPTHFKPLSKIFGDDVILSVSDDGQVRVTLLENPSERLAQLASTLLNNSHLVTDIYSTVHARDLHYFVRADVHDAASDARALSMLTDSATVEGVNVSIHRHLSDAQQLRHVDIRLQSAHTVFNIRYGSTVQHERHRALRHAAARAEDAAWLIERELAQSNKLSMYSWSPAQRQQLITTGRISSMKTTFFRDIHSFPALSDDPKNVRFLPGR